MNALRASLEDMRAGKVVPGEDMPAEMKNMLAREAGTVIYRVVITARARADTVEAFLLDRRPLTRRRRPLG